MRASSDRCSRNADCKIVDTALPPVIERSGLMDIRFVSSLTAEDENFFAPALLKAISAVLDQLPIAYTLRIETTGAEVFQHTHAGADCRPTGELFRPTVTRGCAIECVHRFAWRPPSSVTRPPFRQRITPRETEGFQIGDLSMRCPSAAAYRRCALNQRLRGIWPENSDDAEEGGMKASRDSRWNGNCDCAH